MNDLDIFEYMYEEFILHEPVKLFEAFSGVGTQAMSLKRLGIKYESVGFSEINKHSITSYTAIHGNVPNYGDISKMDSIPECDICTWSFPCQDISLAGKQRGMVEGSNSNYGYVFLDVLEKTQVKPKVLLMENVPMLATVKFKRDLLTIQNRLESMGYRNYIDILNAKDFGIAQNRDRIFIVSIQGDYYYQFPKRFQLTKTLKEYLEKKVDPKYYLSRKQIEQILYWKSEQSPLANAKSKDDPYIQTITAKGNTTMNHNMLLIKENTKTGYKEATDGDGIYINQIEKKRGTVQKGMIQTIKANCSDIGVVIEEDYTLFDVKSTGNFKRKPSKNVSPALLTDSRYHILENSKMRVRKLLPIEAWRLMGISDEDFYKAKAAGVSDTQLYRQAGNAIVVDVLVHIFASMFKKEIPTNNAKERTLNAD